MTVVSALTVELEGLGMADSALGASALVLALELDDPTNSASSKSMCAKALTETLARIAELAALKPRAVDVVDQIAVRRAVRRAG